MVEWLLINVGCYGGVEVVEAMWMRVRQTFALYVRDATHVCKEEVP